MPAWAMRNEGQSAIDCPSKRISPWCVDSMPMMLRTVVVLPMPLRPSSVTHSPAGAENVTSNSAWLAPYQAESLTTSRSAIESARGGRQATMSWSPR